MGQRENFPTTSWSLVMAAGAAAGDRPAEAMARLCEAYWYPLYTYVRRTGHGVDDSQDLTQEFFARVLERHYLNDADRDRGRFRSFLLASLKHFLANEWDRARAQKRGGGKIPISLDTSSAEDRYRFEPVESLTPEVLFDRRWAMTLLDRALARLDREYASARRPEVFIRIKDLLLADGPRVRYESAAAELKMSESALKVAVHRARRRFGEILRSEVAETVATPADAQAEIRYLLRVLES
jgi:RNA polymerase sigma-70 factor (ECF subfamily)